MFSLDSTESVIVSTVGLGGKRVRRLHPDVGLLCNGLVSGFEQMLRSLDDGEEHRLRDTD